MHTKCGNDGRDNNSDVDNHGGCDDDNDDADDDEEKNADAEDKDKDNADDDDDDGDSDATEDDRGGGAHGTGHEFMKFNLQSVTKVVGTHI